MAKLQVEQDNEYELVHLMLTKLPYKPSALHQHETRCIGHLEDK